MPPKKTKRASQPRIPLQPLVCGPARNSVHRREYSHRSRITIKDNVLRQDFSLSDIIGAQASSIENYYDEFKMTRAEMYLVNTFSDPGTSERVASVFYACPDPDSDSVPDLAGLMRKAGTRLARIDEEFGVVKHMASVVPKFQAVSGWFVNRWISTSELKKVWSCFIVSADDMVKVSLPRDYDLDIRFTVQYRGFQ